MKTDRREKMNKENVNHFLTLFIGEKWNDDMSIPNNLDFYTPNDFDRLMKWMEKNNAELWDKYLATCADNAFEEDWMLHRDRLGYTEALNAQLNPSNLFEFLVEHREEWEWAECKYCYGKGEEL